MLVVGNNPALKDRALQVRLYIVYNSFTLSQRHFSGLIEHRVSLLLYKIFGMKIIL